MHVSDPLWMKGVAGECHVAAGFCSFVLAPVALATAKGGKQHRRWGMVYLWSMGVVAATALPMALYPAGVVSGAGGRVQFLYGFLGLPGDEVEGAGEGWWECAPDRLGCGGYYVRAPSAALAGLGAFKPHAVQNLGIVAIVFGLLGMRFAAIEMRKFIWKPKDKMFWWYTHLGNFIGSYIAAWSAFSVVTLAPMFRHPTLGVAVADGGGSARRLC